jgi:hypothetical protein
MFCVWLISLINAPKVVVLPLPAAPVTMMIPFFSLVMSRKIWGQP